MDLTDDARQAEFRARVRGYLSEHGPHAPAVETNGDGGADRTERIAALKTWQRVLAEGGLAGVAWPSEFGGQGLGAVEEVIVAQELQAAGLPGILDFIGIGMLGPTLIAHGTDEQKHRYLGPMLHAEEPWCQLFSEPAAGSDLAAIRTRAKSHPDGGWVVDGQKVWTTNAQFASYGMLLARTDPDVPKHKGLSMFVVPMDAEGVDIRPLRQIDGDAHFNEVFFDGVRLAEDTVIGAPGDGWRVALTVLMFERLAVANQAESFGVSHTSVAAAIAQDPDASRSDETRARLGELGAELLAHRYGNYRTMTLIQKGQAPGPEAGLSKITLTRAAAEAADLVADVLGPEALAEPSPWSELTSLVPGLKSAGGTEEILRSTIGERVLGLPPEPRMDKGMSFNEARKREGA